MKRQTACLQIRRRGFKCYMLHCHFQSHSDETAHNGRAAFI